MCLVICFSVLCLLFVISVVKVDVILLLSLGIRVRFSRLLLMCVFGYSICLFLVW